MEDKDTTWLATKDIMARWQCTAETVSRRLKRTGAQPTKFGAKNWLTLAQVIAIEDQLGVTGIVAAMNRQDA